MRNKDSRFQPSKIFTESGFTAPDASYFKRDPRGEEYGYFWATRHALQEGFILVKKFNSRESIEYEFVISEDYFNGWARACT